MSYYLHKTPGRVRVKTPHVKGNPRKAALVKERLEGIAGVKNCVINTVTGSITVNYDSAAITSRFLVETLHSDGHFDMTKAITNDQYIHGMATKAGLGLSKLVFGALIEKSFEGSALAVIGVLL